MPRKLSREERASIAADIRRLEAGTALLAGLADLATEALEVGRDLVPGLAPALEAELVRQVADADRALAQARDVIGRLRAAVSRAAEGEVDA